jgi:hypothetical protein
LTNSPIFGNSANRLTPDKRGYRRSGNPTFGL